MTDQNDETTELDVYRPHLAELGEQDGPADDDGHSDGRIEFLRSAAEKSRHSELWLSVLNTQVALERIGYDTPNSFVEDEEE